MAKSITPRKSATTTLRKLRKFADDNRLNATEVADLGGFANSTTWTWLNVSPIPSLHYDTEQKIKDFLASMKGTKVTDADDQLPLPLEPVVSEPAQVIDPAIAQLTRKLREQEFVLEAYRKGEL